MADGIKTHLSVKRRDKQIGPPSSDFLCSLSAVIKYLMPLSMALISFCCYKYMCMVYRGRYIRKDMQKECGRNAEGAVKPVMTENACLHKSTG